MNGAIDDLKVYEGQLNEQELDEIIQARNETQFDNFYSYNGNIGINDSKPDYDLDVYGTIRSTEIIVEVQPGTGPDFVFSDDYKLSPLSEIEKYILEHHHLPQVPSAIELETEGLNVGEMNLLLLQKIEELTLHIIRQEKEIQALKKQQQ